MEHEFHRWLKQLPQNESPEIRIGIGDDAAVLSRSDYDSVITTDTIAEGTHFDLSVHSLELVGRKSLAVNLSDIAAMGAEPESAIVSLVLPRSFTIQQTKQLFTGIATAASKYGIVIIGGDTCSHEGPLMISVAATGRIAADSKVPDGWRMDGAKAGDIIVVSGPLGGSIHGKHLDFVPRVELAREIQQRVIIHAATDISDSFSIDLAHLIRKSNVGAVIDLKQIPIADAAENDVVRALQDGEDFELLICLPRQAYDDLDDDSSFDHQLTVVGEVTADHPGRIVNLDTGEDVEVGGYEHR